MSKILQISDIHINGEYDGLFDVKKHLKQILDEAVLTDYKAVVLTGDIADNGTVQDYTDIFNQIEEVFSPSVPILAIPGNHDNRQNLDFAYMDYIDRTHNFSDGVKLERIGGTFEEPGKCVVILTLPYGIGFGYKLVGMDNAHKDLPHDGLEALINHEWDHKEKYTYYMFAHMPFIKPFHRFMNVDEHSIREDAAKTFLRATAPMHFQAIFCGHYHCASVLSYGDFLQYVSPASQAQLDQFSKTCAPSGNFPGYTEINLGVNNMHLANFKYVVEEPKPEESRPEVQDGK